MIEREERAAPAGAFDGRYAAATAALINRTQDKKQFARLYHENVVVTDASRALP
jgi:hypothetical protein